MRTDRRTGRAACACTLLATLPAGVCVAGTGDFVTPYVGVSARYDDNLFRLPDDFDPRFLLGTSHRSDWSRTTYAGAAIDWQPGLQQISGDLSASKQSFARFNGLDNTGLSGRGDWAIAVANRLTGRARVNYQQALGSFEDFRDTVKDTLTTRSSELELSYLVTPDVDLRAAVGDNSTGHDVQTRQLSDLTEWHWLVGAGQRTPLGNRIGIEFRQDTGSFPNRDFNRFSTIDNGYTQQTASLTGAWQGGFARLDGKLGYAWRRFDHFGERNTAGVSGDLGLHYDYSAKLALDLSAYRHLQSLDDARSSSVIETGARLAPTWALSDRLLVSVEGSYRDRAYQDSGRLPGASPPKETTHIVGLDVRYSPRSFVTFTAGVEQGSRRSSEAGFDYDYRAGTLSVQAQM
jgi:exopolysaccharide biosynthesis operon protein EpsL